MTSSPVVCPRCGNQIPEWASGVCYTCLRIEKEEKRYGRRQSRRGSSTPHGKSRERSQDMVACYTCGKLVRADRLASHKWYAHGTKKGSKPKGDAQQVAVESQPLTTSSLIPCPICAFSMLADQLPEHLRYHERQSISGYVNRQLQREGINRLLQDIYGAPHFLSDILREGGLSNEEIYRLRYHYLDEYLANLVRRLCVWWATTFAASQARFLILHYKLAGQPGLTTGTEETTGNEALSLHEACLKRLRARSGKRQLERIIVNVAQHLLSESSQDDFV
ncbi:MAG: hypothetical protein L0322_11265 [Chloroflexi bacterium]|nr:hypothetical protein [Chloroflexota bacterium]MCI0576857.1 hypothetical protein [Chloroflexota bacterium]MCI0643651.1 hypothetical protein [Chloroflexota bacterium]